MKVRIAIVVIILFKYSWLYSNLLYQDNKKNTISPSLDDKNKWYEVTETINMPFGKSIIVYTVSNKNLISTNDLGPNNTRVIVEKSKTKKGIDNPKVNSNTVNTTSIDSNTSNEKKETKTVNVSPFETYERMVEKGVKSIDIFKSLGDSYFFKNEYVKAIKYYEALFKMTHDLEPEYYFRYSNALKNMGQIASSEELLEKYKLLIAKQKN
ncbi:tetratricopeptide repeat protein [Flavobacterium sp. RSSB_23]|uniref:tetratricopeptide repeat protein n=1 Tax=Flavobacterium sp. RSSB_23 TaxID=3447668 RepID=UPI003F33E807